jgi:hypothetical protein
MDLGVFTAAALLAMDRSLERALNALQPSAEQTQAAKRTRVQRDINARVAAMPTRPTTHRIRYASRGANRHH